MTRVGPNLYRSVACDVDLRPTTTTYWGGAWLRPLLRVTHHPVVEQHPLNIAIGQEAA